MDFILGLPKITRKYDSVLVVVDRFSKMTHFLPYCQISNASKVARIYFSEIVRLHGLPKIIISDRDVRFMSYFWKTLWHLLGTKLKFFSTYHPQIDGQTKVVNRSLKNLLHWLIKEHMDNWDLLLSRAKFAYNSSVNRSTGMSPFKVIHGYQSRKSIDLIPLPMYARIFESAEPFI